MLEAAVMLLRAPLTVLGLAGCLIVLGLVFSDQSRWLGRSCKYSDPHSRELVDDRERESQT